MTNQHVWDQHATWRAALNATGRKMWLSICPEYVYEDAFPDEHCTPGFAYTTRGWTAMGLDPRELANGILIEYCNNSPTYGESGSAGGMLSMIDSQQLLTYDNLTAPGAFSDMDMLEACNDGLRVAAWRSQMAVWSIMASPLILGNDPRNMSKECLDIIGNEEIIALNQVLKFWFSHLLTYQPGSSLSMTHNISL
jgi:alpha-galactosidase